MYKWFKHYNDASKGLTIGTLLSQGDHEAVCVFWILLELLSRFEDQNRSGFINLKLSFIGRETNMKPTKARRVLARISAVSPEWNWSFSAEECSFLVPNWLKLQGTPGPNLGRSTFKQGGRSKKREVRSKKKEEVESFGNDPSPSQDPIFTIYNEQRGQLPEAKGMNATRRRKSELLWKQKPDTKYWEDTVRVMASTPFILGENPRGWRGSFDWLLQPDVHLKINEGKYKNAKEARFDEWKENFMRSDK
jgi:hypothetical protein